MKILKRIFWCFAVIAALLFVSCEMVAGDDEDSENDDTYIEAGSENTKNVTITLPPIEHALDSALRTISDADADSLQDSIKAYRVKMNGKKIDGKPTGTGITYSATFAVDTTVTVIVECLDEYNKVIVRARKIHTVVNEGSNDLEINLKGDGIKIDIDDDSDEQEDGDEQPPIVPPIEEDDRVTAVRNVTAKILQDSESSDVIMNKDKRWWKLTEPVRIETKTDYNGAELTLGDDQILLTSYSLYPITGIEVFDGAGADAKYLFTIGDISELAQNVYTIPEGGESTTGKYVVKSNDEHFLKITAMKMPMTLKFHKLNDLWGNLNPIEAREYIAFWTNVGFTFSSNEFDILLNNYVQLTGGKFKDDHNSAYVTEHDLANEPGVVAEIKRRIFQAKTLNIGLLGSETENDGDTKGGQATASALGITTVNFAKLYFIGIGVGVHEFGHTIDYDHKSSFSLDLQNYAGGLSACFIRLGKAPYSNKDLIGYCKEENLSKRKIQDPKQAMLSAKYNDAEVERNYTHFYQKYVGRIDNVWIGYKFEPGRNPAEGGSAIITTEEQTRESTQFINVFEKAVYNNKSLYPDLHKALKTYFDTAIAAKIDLTK